ncbi:MAG: FAD-dependent oxidoreductase [Patescibacteria group bacterium]|nr:FAD-dependent oxidoreductase [Patescibacteria group bacterium]
MSQYDLIIIGTGPAGLSAAVYAARYQINFLLIGQLPGGLITESPLVENYLGIQSISGFELSQKMLEQIKFLGHEPVFDKVTQITHQNKFYQVKTSQQDYQAKSLILAMGAHHRKLNLPREEELNGKGVAYCATCDGPLYKDKVVAVAGAANSGLGSAFILAKYAQHVYVIEMLDKILADKSWQSKIEKLNNVDIILSNQITALKGQDRLESIVLKEPFQDQTELNVAGLFIEIGLQSNSQLAQNLNIDLDERGYIKINMHGQTNLPGVMAAGNVTSGQYQFDQVITAAASGAIAADSANKFLS